MENVSYFLNLVSGSVVKLNCPALKRKSQHICCNSTACCWAWIEAVKKQPFSGQNGRDV
jgi:hypothetical protein